MGKDKRSSPRQIVDVGDQIILHHTSNGKPSMVNGRGLKSSNGGQNGHQLIPNGHGNGHLLHPSNGHLPQSNGINGSNGHHHHNNSSSNGSNGHHQQRRSSLSRSSRNGHHRGVSCPSSASSSSPPLPPPSNTTPICRCRVMYLGSSVPHATKDGLQGIQEPLRDLYPEEGLIKSNILNGGGHSTLNGGSGGGLYNPHHMSSNPGHHPMYHNGANGQPINPTMIAHNGFVFPPGPPPPLPPSMPPPQQQLVLPPMNMYNNSNGHIQPYHGLNGHGHHHNPMTDGSGLQLISLQSSESIGIDSWLSVWSNGILIENVDDSGNEVKKFFPIESLHYCAAVRFVTVPSVSSDRITKFLPLDSPFSRHTDTSIHPPLFACILRRTTGIKVLECHAFICKREPAANALVRSCFHAYADSVHAKQMNIDIDSVNGGGLREYCRESCRDSCNGSCRNSVRDSARSSDRERKYQSNHNVSSNGINGRRDSSSHGKEQQLVVVNGHDDDNEIKPI